MAGERYQRVIVVSNHRMRSVHSIGTDMDAARAEVDKLVESYDGDVFAATLTAWVIEVDLAALVRDHPTEAMAALIESGALQQVGWRDEGYAEHLFEMDDNPEDHADDVADPALQPVYRVREASDGG